VTLDEITRYLHEHIPLTRHLGAVVEAWDGTSIRLGAPLAPNLNHRSTAFGGSLSALAILSGWALVHLSLRDRGIDARVVIQRTELDFQEPVDGDFTATSALPPAADWERFLATLRRHRRARIAVSSTLEAGSGVGGEHRGTYVAVLGAPSS
jgi:thioesterase domain-containing protein